MRIVDFFSRVIQDDIEGFKIFIIRSLMKIFLWSGSLLFENTQAIINEESGDIDSIKFY